MRWGAIKIISLLRERGSGHDRVADTPLGSGFTTDEVRSGHVRKLGLRWLGLAPVARWRSRVTHRDIGRRQGALRLPRRLCERKSRDPPILGASFTWSLRLINYWGVVS